MASVKRITNKNGRVVYRIVISMGRTKQGARRVKSLTYSVNQSATRRQQEKEALLYAMEMEDRMKYGHEPGEGEILFEDFAQKWLEHVRGSLACGTYTGYEQLLRAGILPYFKGYKLAQVKMQDIEDFYQMLAARYALGTIRRYANVLNCIFKAAVRREILEENPCRYARKPRLRQSRELRYFTPEQSLMFLKSLDLPLRKVQEDGSAKEYTVSTGYKVFYALSLFCGLRKGETLALNWPDIHFESKEISVTKSIGRTEEGFRSKETKNAASVRKIPFPDIVCLLLEKYRQEYDERKICPGSRQPEEEALFVRRDGRRMGHTTPYQHFTKHLKQYNQWVRDYPQEAFEKGLEELPAIPLHGLRHSCATLLNYLDVNIVDISKYLGHASCSTTMNIYAHSFEARKQAAREKLNIFLKDINSGT